MLTVKLYTQDGQGYVATVQVPPFQPMPKGLLWGQRAFFYVDDTKYVEDLLYVVPPAQLQDNAAGENPSGPRVSKG